MLGMPKHLRTSLSLDHRPLACTWLAAAVVLVLLPHAIRLPLWVTLAAGCLVVYHLLYAYGYWRLPPPWVGAVFALLALSGIVLNFGLRLGQETSTAFLIVLLGLKLLETRTQRDAMVVSFIGYFLLLAYFFASQSPGTVLYFGVTVWLLTVTLIHLQHLGDITALRWRTSLRQGSVLVVQAVPLMVVLFILFPRLDGPLWRFPQPAGIATTGLSDRLSPGDISQLIASHEVAFRAKFTAAIPPPELRYWRGLVLWDYDGRTWQQGPLWSHRPIQWGKADTSYTYTITLEPHAQRWLFSLDLPYAWVRHGQVIPFTRADYYGHLGLLTADLQLQTPRPINTIRRYTLLSYARYASDDLTKSMRFYGLRLPANVHPEVYALAMKWRQASNDDADTVQRALQYFHDQPFTYTLTPPALVVDPTYEFLFVTRRGYCEHFASSFAVLMRAAGIPTRIVVGYQGGVVNTWSQHVTIRQSHAHAWAEVWLDSQGWVRIDPTAAVAPSRIERGIEALPELLSDPILLRYNSWLSALWQQIGQGWEAMHYAWNRWVLDYSVERQIELMQWLGLGELTWRGLTMLMVGLLSGMLVVFALRLARQQTPRDRVVMAYQRFCRKLARRGLVRQRYEGPLDFAQRVKHRRPELTAQVEDISTLYSTLRYGQQHNGHDLKRLRQAVRLFRP